MRDPRNCPTTSEALAALQRRNAERVQALTARGVQMPDLQKFYLVAMLEHLIGTDDLPFVQLTAEQRVAGFLDQAEPAVTRAVLLNGTHQQVPGAQAHNGRFTPPKR